MSVHETGRRVMHHLKVVRAIEGSQQRRCAFRLVVLAKQWRCLLVEANPNLATVFRALYRKWHCLSGRLFIIDGVSSFPFVLAAPPSAR